MEIAPRSAFVEINGCRQHYLEMGTGPAVIFCHGFPEIAHSWRHQMPAVALAGYRAIALDMRGHGRSACPDRVEDYSVLHTVGDVIGLMDRLEIGRAVIVGHDAGTTTAYHAALMRPDRFRGVMGLSVPFIPRGPASLLDSLKGQVPDGFYMLHFQTPGIAEAELEHDVEDSFRRLMFANSGDWPGPGPMMMIVPPGGTILDALPSSPKALSFMNEHELRLYVDSYKATGFRGGLNGYRVFQRNWELTAPWAGMMLPVPAAYVGGERDTVLHFPGFRAMAEAMGPATGGPPARFIPEAGHWIQNERPHQVNEALLSFLEALSN